MRRLLFLPLALALLFAPAQAHARPDERPAITAKAEATPTAESRPVVERASTPSTPIELDEAPARPAKDELTGGLVGLVIGLIVIGAIVVLIVALTIGISEHHHHHIFVECEECRHRPPPPPRFEGP